MTAYEPMPGRNRQGRPQLAPETQELADELARRAAEIHAGSDGELSITEAVALAAFRMGVEDGYRSAQTATDETGD